MNHAAVAPNLAIVDGQPVTTSIDIAEKFVKKHKDVLRAVRGLDCSEDFRRRNFAPSSYLNEQGRAQPMFQMTKNGFAFLVMGFTGKEAAVWKERYIAAFDAMADELMAQADTTERRRVDVNHNHLRLTNAPGGLDIKYTLDLTKVLLAPSSRTLNLLSRVTGIDFSDIVASPVIKTDLVESLVVDFLQTRCTPMPNAITNFAQVYDAYASWFATLGEMPIHQAHKRRFGIILTAQGFGRDMRAGVCRITGLALAEEVLHG